MAVNTFDPFTEPTERRTTPSRKLAQAILAQGLETTPVYGKGQGFSRMAQALLGGLLVGQEDKADREREAATVASLYAHPAFGGAAPDTTPEMAPAAPAMDAPRPMPNVAPGRIYGENEPSPIDPPSGQDRDMLARTVFAEAGNQGPTGMNAVASVVRNRAVNGGYGGDTAGGVVTARNQFEPWNTGGGRAKMAAIDPASPAYIAADRSIDSAYAGNDPTNGAVNFISPKLQSALGRQMPGWAQGPGQDIGNHRFFGGAPADPTQAPYQVAGPAVAPGQPSPAPSPQAAPTGNAEANGLTMSPAVRDYTKRLIANPATRAQGMSILAQYIKPVEQFTQETDAAGNVFNVNRATGQKSLLVSRDKGEKFTQETDANGNVWNVSSTGQRTVALKPEAEPTSVREYNYYRSNLPAGQTAMPYDTWSTAKARASATTVNNNMGGGTDKQVFDSMDERAKIARATAQGLTGIRNAREAIDGGAISGFRADNRQMLAKAGKYFGLTDAKDVENGEVFKAAIAPQVAAVLRSTVGTANISDSDRRFAERAAGGSLDLEEGSIKRLLDIMERASNAQLEDHQAALDSVYPDPVAHKRERALFGVRVTPGGKPAGKTATGATWNLE